jgi:hypothetical protein
VPLRCEIVPLFGSVGAVPCLPFERVSGAEGSRMVPEKEATNVVGVIGSEGSSLAVASGVTPVFTLTTGTFATAVVSAGVETAEGTTEGGESMKGLMTGDDSVSRQISHVPKGKGEKIKCLWLSKVLVRGVQEEH